MWIWIWKKKKKEGKFMVVSVRALHDRRVLLRNLKKVTKEMMA